MELPLVVIGFVVGFAAAAFILSRRATRRDTVAAFRAAPIQSSTADPYRGEASAPATPSLDELVAAARAAKLEVRTAPTGFSLARGPHVVTLRVPDPARVPIAALDLVDSGHETLIFELALAFLPLYGPIVVTEAMWGAYLVDGRKPPTALHEERGERIRDMARGIQARLAASQPDWDQLRDKLGGSR